MNHNIKKIIFGFTFSLLACFLFVCGISRVYAQAPCVSSTSTYCLLAPLPGLGNSVNTTTGIGTYLNTMIKILIGLMSVLAVIMLVVGGIQYMLSNMAGEKASAKDRMTNAIFGLILALSSYLILNTINPNLVNLKIGIQNVTVNLFNNNASGQDGLGVGATALVGVGNKVKDSYTGDEIIAGATSGTQSHLLTVYLATISQPTNCYASSVPGSIQLASTVDVSFVNALNKWCNDRYAMDSSNPDKNYEIMTLTGFNGNLAPGNNALQSSHSFGIAVDIEPAATGTLPMTLVNDFKSFGWGWGGDLANNKDYKHFSKLQEENGSGNDSYARE